MSVQAKSGRYADNSVLSTGNWMKIQVDSTGIYKLSHADLKKMGFADPSKVSVHGYGGWPQEEDFNKIYPTGLYVDDLPNVPVWQEADYLLFYAKGPVKWEYNAKEEVFIHTNNPYSTVGYYFLTDEISPRTMEKVASTPGAGKKQTMYDDYLLHESELGSVNFSGRQLFGESFEATSSRTFNKYIPGIVNTEAKVRMRFIARPTSGEGSVVMSINDEAVIQAAITATNDSYTKANAVVRTAAWKGEKKENIPVKIMYGRTGDKNARLDYFSLQVKRELRPYGGYTFFRSIASIQQATTFIIQGANEQTLVFDVSDGLNPKKMEATLSGSELSFTIPAGGELREFAIVQKDRSLRSPETVGKIENQNLHALPQTDMVIIAPAAFKKQAEQLADAHRDPMRDGLTVEVVDPIHIYNEFSSGTPDATAYRSFMKMFYDRSESVGKPPQYLLLFGDGFYDNRGISADISIRNLFAEFGDRFLLTFQSENSLNGDSYVTDDYFAFLNDTGGGQIDAATMHVGVGRLPVRTQTEATQVVNKLIGYMNNTQLGAWKNRLCFVADDGNNTDEYTTTHVKQADELGTFMEDNHSEFLVNKIYFDAYKKESVGGQMRYPDVNYKIQRLLKDGLLILNYTGHGDTRSWAEERVMTETDIQNATYSKLPLWITATCDFTRFDDINTSAGELVLLNKTSGGIALFTTTRVAYSDYNFTMNKQLISRLFEKDEEGKRKTLGQVMRETKSSLRGVNKLNFILIGDPAMKLAYPENQMRVTSVNGEPVTYKDGQLEGEPFLFSASKDITIEGEILGADGKRVTDFNGWATPTVFDSPASLQTLNNNGKGSVSYTDYTNKLFAGKDNVQVADGTFSFSFEVPVDISYSGEQGKINLYASDDATSAEAQGAFLHYTVGGTNENAAEDDEGPEIREFYLNDTTFVDGGKVNSTPLLVTRVWDKSGINITGSSLGHNIMLIIDEQPTRSYVLNDYYAPATGADREGVVIFPIPELSPGIHTAEFIVWDIRNNSSRDTLTFEVVEGLKPNLVEVMATPNPAREQAEFRLIHNRPETNMNVRLMVYDMTGRLRWSHTETGSSELFKSYIVSWDLRDNAGGRLLPGIYFYRAGIRANNSKEVTKANKLIILAQ